jgi:hypothetical protein
MKTLLHDLLGVPFGTVVLPKHDASVSNNVFGGVGRDVDLLVRSDCASPKTHATIHMPIPTQQRQADANGT